MQVELHSSLFANRFSVDSNMANPNTVALSPAGRHGPLIGFFERVPIIAGGAVAVGAAGAVPEAATGAPPEGAGAPGPDEARGA